MRDVDTLLAESVQGMDQARLDLLGENAEGAMLRALMAQASGVLALALLARAGAADRGQAPLERHASRGDVDLLRDSIQGCVRSLAPTHPARERATRTWNDFARKLAADGYPVGDLTL